LGDKGKPNAGLVQTKKFHNSSVTNIKFNQKSNIFACGSRDVTLITIDPKSITMSVAFNCPSQDDGEVTSLSWNDKVAHILAVATSNGNVYIWDMKKAALYLTIQDQQIASDDDYKKDYIHTSVIWCIDGVQLIIAYDHPEFNFLTQYDMRQPNAPSAEYHGGHSKSIYDLSRNSADTNYMLSLGRDNTVTCWSIRTAKPILHIPNIQASQIIWLPKVPDHFLSVDFNGSVTPHQVNFTEGVTSDEIPPKWLLKRSGLAFGFGGKLATFSDKFNTNVNVHTIQGDSQMKDKMQSFIEKVEKADLTEVLDEKIAQSTDKNIMLMWISLKCRFSNNYNELFRAMGFDKTKLQNEVYQVLGKKIQKEVKKRDVLNTQQRNLANTLMQQSNDDALGFWDVLAHKQGGNNETNVKEKENNLPQEKPTIITEQVSKNINWNQGSEKLIKQCLLIGDLESAVDVALKCGRDAEALLIASADKDLFNRTKQSFFNKNKDLFVKNIFSSIINGDFDNLLEYNVLKDWKEYMLYSKTYLSNEKFISFANAIADKLASSNEVSTAIICYILGENYNKCIELLYNNYVRDTAKLNKKEKKEYMQNIFEIVITIKYVLTTGQTSNEHFDKIIAEYCEFLIEEGLFVQAYSYLSKIKNNHYKNLVLLDRLYNHCDSKLSHFIKAAFPFSLINVKPKVVVVKQQAKVGAKVGPGVNKPSNNLFPDDGGNNPFSTSTTPTGTQSTRKPFPGVQEPSFTSPPHQHNKPIQPPIVKPGPKTPFPDQPKPVEPVTTPPQTQQFVPKQPQPFKPIQPPKPNIKVPVLEEQPKPQPIVTPPQQMKTQTVNPPLIKPPIKPVNPMTVPGGNMMQQQQQKVPQQAVQQQKVEQQMSADEEFIYQAFENYQQAYNSVYQDETKQKDFNNKISSLFQKLQSHDFKPNLIGLLIEFTKSKNCF
jgi:protein transport protein SEC31